MRARLKREEGFGLIELVIAMTVLNIGVLAIVAAFNSGAVSLSRASLVSNATALADKKMELYRGLRNCAIYLVTPLSNVASYTGDTAYNATQVVDNMASIATPMTKPSACPAAALPPTIANTRIPSTDPDPTLSHQQVTAPNGRQFWIDTYIVVTTVNSVNLKLVTIIVRDSGDATNVRALVRESSTFSSYAAPDTG